MQQEIQVYPARLPVYHFDAYRLATAREFTDLGTDEYFHGDGVCLVEWADRVPEALPAERLEVRIEVVDAERRRFTVTSFGSSYDQTLSEWISTAKA